MTSSNPEEPSSSSQELHFPPVRVNHSLARLDLNTLMMRSNQARNPPKEAHSSLEDSSYEVLGESMCDASDDEGNTESLASTTPDDVSSISDGDEFDDDDDEYANEASQHLPEPDVYNPLEHFASSSSSPNASMMTSMADTQTGEASSIRLEEEVREDGSARACGIVGRFSEARELPQILRGYGLPDLRLTVRMTLSERYLPVPRSYRILYVGEFPEWGVKEINARIGAALDATPSSSRFNIVQGPAYPGSTSSSNIQLERSGLELVVDHCNHPKVSQQPGSPPRAVITLDDGTELTFGPGKSITFKGQSSTDSLPDLVIFCHYTIPSESDTTAGVEKMHLTREAFRRHSIPCLDIATTRPYGKSPYGIPSDDSSLRLCMEGRTSNDEPYEILETLPIDIYTFASIDPSELNRHLASISPRSPQSRAGSEGRESRRWSLSEIVPGFGDDSHSNAFVSLLSQPRMWLAVLALSAIISAHLAGLTSFAAFSPNTAKDAVNGSVSAAVSISTPATSQITRAPQPVAPPLGSLSVRPSSQDLSIMPSFEKTKKQPRKGAKPAEEEQSGGLEIEVKGPQTFTIRPLKQFANKKRKHQLDVHVSRDSEPVPVHVSPSQDSDSYIVTLQQQYPLGVFDVDVVLRRKPLLQQTIQVEMGTPKSGIVDLIVGAQAAQDTLKVISTHLSKTVHAGVAVVEDKANTAFEHTCLWKDRITHSTQTVAEHLEGAKQEATRRIAMGSKVSKEVSSMLWKNYQEISARVKADVREASTNIKKSEPVRRARKNVDTLRKKFRKNRSKDAGHQGEKSKKRSKAGKRNKRRGKE
ncbi:hypothetical protein BU24DRAFT_423942 [Aaosphaeria arxii CBS 175.79]|uniref:Uncharacterized protein n=1 Tax=Aaosphaeria arxii CBS 175.79 TaxID=1450172 RepID=A0A6A5XP39_9PLEO|nr:uncharacterized protein BU24DRAFT_423942 [Aaosphaeria arxii CBS 175.79]KAF2015025.1 hypothetical protein BU24DRAFT_423942 [Aaosphaeria arxii CBS 175.79]